MFQIILRKALIAISISQGRRKLHAYAKSAEYNSKVGKEPPKNQTPRKRAKKIFSFGKKLKSLTKREAKKPITPETAKSCNTTIKGSIFEKHPQTTTVPEHIKVLNALNANLDRVLQSSRAPYEHPTRSKRSLATKRLMTTMVKQQQNPPIYPNYAVPSLGNPFLGQNSMLFPRQLSPSNQYAPSSPVFPIATNAFNLNFPPPRPVITPLQFNPYAASSSQKAYSPFIESPTTAAVPFTSNTIISPVPSLSPRLNAPVSPFLESPTTAVPFMEPISHAPNLNPELSPIPHKAKKSKKHKRSKKKQKKLDDLNNAAFLESPAAPQEQDTSPTSNIPSATTHNIESSFSSPFSQLQRSTEAANMAPNINGINTLPVRIPTARRRSMLASPRVSNAMEMKMTSSAFPTEANVNATAGDFPTGYADMEDIAESRFFSRVPNFSAPDSPPNAFGSSPSDRARPHHLPISIDTDCSLNRPLNQSNEFRNSIYEPPDHMVRHMSPPNRHGELSTQNSNGTYQSILHPPVNAPSFSPDMPLPDTQNSGSIPGYSFWR